MNIVREVILAEVSLIPVCHWDYLQTQIQGNTPRLHADLTQHPN